jgi:DNA-directed RNA polymerase subunit N (RpoN/RPB10)
MFHLTYVQVRCFASCSNFVARRWMMYTKVIESNDNYYSHFVGENKILRHCPTCLELRLRMKTARGSMQNSSALVVTYC